MIAVKSRLLWKLLGIIVLVIVAAMVIVWVAIDFFAVDYFTFLMEKYNIPKEEIQQIFLDSAHRYLMWANVIAVIAAMVMGYVLIKMVLGPLYRMIQVTRKIAIGDYTAKVEADSNDEVGQLATEFNRMSTALQRQEQLRKNMVVNVAHELRSPLTNMRGYLEALSDGVLPFSQKIVESLNEEALRLGNLVEELMRLSVADSARLTMEREKVDLRELLSHGLNLFQLQFADKAIVVENRFSNEQLEITGDSEKLEQVIQNILHNAWQYTAQGGRVSVSAGRAPGFIKATFANTGETIPAEDLALIFERFYRVDKSRSRDSGGTGIGLAIVKELVEAHGGEVGAESSGGYIRIWFTLPA